MKLFACIEADRPVLLRHWLDHHTDLGVTDLFFALHIHARKPELVTETERLLQEFSTAPIHRWDGPFSGTEKHMHLTSMIREFAEPHEWIMLADLDEFRVFPKELGDFIQECDALGATYVQGELIDRIGDNGSLPELKPEPSIWEQYPLGCAITRSIVQGWSAKLVMLRAGIPFTYGHHYLRDDIRAARASEQYPEILPIHHFKWDAACVDRLSARVELFRSQGNNDFNESDRVLQFLHTQGGVFPPGHVKVRAVSVHVKV